MKPPEIQIQILNQIQMIAVLTIKHCQDWFITTARIYFFIRLLSSVLLTLYSFLL